MILYSAVVHYHVNDRPFEVTQTVGSGSPTYQQGASVTVLYDPTSPQNARIKSFMELFFLTTLLGFMGWMCIGTGILIFFVFIRGSL